MFVKKQTQFIPYRKFLKEYQWNDGLILDHIGSTFIFLSINYLPAGTDVFKTSSGCLKRSRCLTTKQDVVTMSGKRHRIYDVLKTSDLRRLEDVQFTTCWRRLTYNVFRTSVLRRPEDIWFTTSRRRPIWDVLRTSDLQRLQDVWFTMSWRRPIYDVLKTPNLWRLEDVQFTVSV